MLKILRTRLILSLLIVMIMSLSCKKGESVSELSPTIPVVVTKVVFDITDNTATAKGVISSDGGGVITRKGFCLSTHNLPTIADNRTADGTGPDSFTSIISELVAETKYYVRAYACNNVGTGYGDVISFTTLGISENTVTDIDGNVYKVIKIGNQIWMAENLKTTKLNDGQSIPNVTGMTEWGSLRTPGFCWGNNNPSNKDDFGGLYNWHTVNTGKLAPLGWHVPTINEWKTLITFLGGESVAGGKMKTTSKWFQPNLGGTNESGFSAVPADYRNYDGYIIWNPGDMASFWSTTEVNASYAIGTRLTADRRECGIHETGVKKTYGYSIRCIKD